MGEAKRRKALDPDFGKTTIKQISSLNKEQLIDLGLRFFPMGLLNDFCAFQDKIYEYPSKSDIYENYSETIKVYVEKLEPSIKHKFWDFLLFIDCNEHYFKPYINKVIKETGLPIDNCLVYLWKLLILSSHHSQYSQVVWEDSDEDIEIESWDKMKDFVEGLDKNNPLTKDQLKNIAWDLLGIY